jgi:Spy/CpxP family protein refolding chaperone
MRSFARRRRETAAVVAALGALLILVGLAAAPAAADKMPSQEGLQKLIDQRQEIVRKTLQLDAQQQAAFEPIFTAYESERVALGRERNGFVDDFSHATLAMSPTQADELIDRMFRLRRQRIELDEKFRPQFEAAISPQKTLLLFQLNFILDAVVNYDLAGMVPLAH